MYMTTRHLGILLDESGYTTGLPMLAGGGVEMPTVVISHPHEIFLYTDRDRVVASGSSRHHLCIRVWGTDALVEPDGTICLLEFSVPSDWARSRIAS